MGNNTQILLHGATIRYVKSGVQRGLRITGNEQVALLVDVEAATAALAFHALELFQRQYRIALEFSLSKSH